MGKLEEWREELVPGSDVLLESSGQEVVLTA